MADIARLSDDDKLFEACNTLWNNIVDKKLYITGGIGGTHIGEAFSFNYDLPNDTAYAETCASIGLVFFARRMLEMYPDSATQMSWSRHCTTPYFQAWLSTARASSM